MRAVQTFTVVSKLPTALEPLRDIAMNLGWNADNRAQEVFRHIDGQQWPYVRDPAGMLAIGDPAHLEALATDASFTALATEVRDELVASLGSPRWFQTHHHGQLRQVAYFSPEFGIAAGLPQYSGGLGVLAGDHLKAADALGLPLVGIGLFYHHGYFTQEVDDRGRQLARFPRLDARAMALDEVPGVSVTVEVAGVPVVARVWKASVGRIELYLLDTDNDANDPEHRLITDRLYGGGQTERIRQEILLGIGGVRALAALGIDAEVFHINEGHAGFLALERIRAAVVDHGLTFDEAAAVVRPGGVFTTHTPVPAGIDRFPAALMEAHFDSWCREVGLTFDQLMALGHEPGTPPGAEFNMAVMSLRLSGATNAVSALHGRVSRTMFADVWPQVPAHEVPIGSVTNGVHAPSWTSPEMAEVFTKVVGADWPTADAGRWEAVAAVGNDELWSVRNALRARLVHYVRRRLRRQELRRRRSQSQAAWCDTALDPDALTIGFARRFATYKRAALLLGDPDRLRALLGDPDRPVQLVFAGKAHPADDMGQELIRQVVTAAEQLDVSHRLVFIEDYDIAVARMLVEGCDVWLNTPVRPMEACGTSGMKVVFNGGLNCSVLDGWWDECFTPSVGWALASAEWEADPARRDATEAATTFTVLERQVVTEFYDRDADGVPAAWLDRVRTSMVTLCPQIESTRMLRQYTEQYYEPAARRATMLAADDAERARALVRWRRSVDRAWPSVSVAATDLATEPGGDPTTYRIGAEVVLGNLDPTDVQVQAVVGPVDPDDELRGAAVVAMTPAGPGSVPGRLRFEHTAAFDQPGNFGFTVRVVPSHPDVPNFADVGLVAWAPAAPGR
jgi:starch phosphorylase